jgi:hypothetical protein
VETPQVPQKPFLDVLTRIESWDSGDVEDVDQDKAERGMQTILSEWNKLLSNLQLICLEFESAGIHESSYRAVVWETLNELQVGIRGTDARLQLLGAGIGEALTEGEEGHMSIWEALNSLRTQVSSVTGGLDEQRRLFDAFKAMMPTWKTNFDKMSVSYVKNLPRINTVLHGLSGRIRKLEATAENLLTTESTSSIVNPFLGRSGASNINKIGGASGVTQPEFEAMKLNVKDALEEVRTSILDLKSSGTSASVSTMSDASVAGMQVQFNKVLERLSEIEGRGAGETVSIDGQVFCSEGEVKEWLETNDITEVGVFWDLFSVMCCMKPKKHTGKERSDETYSALRTQSTTLGNDLCAAMSHLRPEVLYAKRGSGSLEPLESGFAACPNHRQWALGSEGYKKQLSHMLEKFVTGVLGNMSSTNAPSRQLANALMANVRMQWSNMCTYMDSFYFELTGVAAFEKEKAWKLVGRCVGALFAALDPYRCLGIARLQGFVCQPWWVETLAPCSARVLQRISTDPLPLPV